MKLRDILIAGALIMTPKAATDITTQITQEELHIILSTQEKQEEESDAPVYFDFELSQELLEQIDTICLDKGCPVVFTRSREHLRNTPLVMKGTRRHIGEYLGYDQYDYILKQYNADTIPDSLKTYDDLCMNTFEKIRFPLIYDAIGKVVPHSLSKLLEDQKFTAYRDSIHPQDNVMINVDIEGKRSFLYYQKGKLLLATYTTIGGEKSTPRGLFNIDYKLLYKRSRKYNNAAMPYSIHVTKNIFIHQGKVSSKVHSHGCNRLPGLYAEALYYLIQSPSLNQVYNSKNNPQDTLLQQEIDSLRSLSPKVLIVD